MWNFILANAIHVRQHARRVNKARRFLQGREELTDPIVEDQEHDQIVIEHSGAFACRFGFSWPRADRIALIELKQRLQLTARDIKVLYFGGNLQRRLTGVHIEGSLGKAVAGWAQIGLIAANFAVPLGLTLLKMPTHPLLGLKATLITAILYAMCWATYLLFVFPQRVLGRTDR